MPKRRRVPPSPYPGALFLALLLAAGCSSGERGEASDRDGAPRSVPAVEVVQVREGTLPLVERVTGTVRASGEVAIFPETSGPIVEVFAQNGDAVRKGDPLIRIQTTGSAAQLEQARSNLAVARAEVREIEAGLANLRTQYDRTRQLGERGLVSRETVDTLEAEVRATEASLARARAQVAAAQAAVAERVDVQRDMVVRSPITGRIGGRNAEVGMRVDPQTQLFVVGRLDEMRVEAPVTQEVLARVRPGQRVELQPGDAASEVITAEVSRISPFLEPGSFSAEVEVEVPNEGRLLPGMFVTMDIFYGESEAATIVPTSALYEDPVTGEYGVFVVNSPVSLEAEDGGLSPDPLPMSFRAVQRLADGRQTTGVAGVAPGEWVVVVGQHLLAQQTAIGEPPRARVRAAEWDRIVELQRLQREDLLHDFMERQRRLARSLDLER